MTVRELTELLKAQDQDNEVVLDLYGDDAQKKIEKVDRCDFAECTVVVIH